MANKEHQNTERYDELLSDEAVLVDLGERLASRRINSGLTQAALAEQAGVSKRTLERMEAGETTQLTSVIRVLRVLGLLRELCALVPEAGPGPMDLLRRQGKPRKRASSRSTSGVREPDARWHWGDGDQ